MNSRARLLGFVSRHRFWVVMWLLATFANPALGRDDRDLLKANAGFNSDVLVILDSSGSMADDFSDAFRLPAYMDDFIYPEGTTVGTLGSKLGVAKSVLRNVVNNTLGVNWAFSYYRNPNQSFGAYDIGPPPVVHANEGAQVAGDLLKNGGVEWMYFAQQIDASSPLSPGLPVSAEFNSNDYPDIQNGRYLTF